MTLSSISIPNAVNNNDYIETGKKRPAKPQVKTACVNCKKAHLACDLSRPCKRCVSSDKTDSCHDIQHKKRGRPKLRTMKTSQSTPLTSSSFTMTQPNHDNGPIASTMTIFLSMELCCARVSDESFDFLGLYPQEFSHRSLYDFIHPRNSNTVARIHRTLLDNAVTFSSSSQHRLLPPTQRTTADMFTSSPFELVSIANGSLTLKEKLWFVTSDQSRHQALEARFYLGGGCGADLDQPDSLHQLYIVCNLSLSEDDGLFDPIALVTNIQPLFPSSPNEIGQLVINTSDTWTTTSSPTNSSSPFSLPSSQPDETPPPLICKKSSHHQGTPPRHGPQQPHQLYYQTMLSSRLSGEAQAFASAHQRRSSPVMSTPPYTGRTIRHLNYTPFSSIP